MSYTATYESADLGTIFIDLFGFVIATITEQADLIIFLLMIQIIAVFVGMGICYILGAFREIK